MRWWHALIAGATLWGCTAGAPPALDAIAEGYVRVALQLAQHDPELVEDWRGPASWRPGPRVPVADVLATIQLVRGRIGPLESASGNAEESRRRYLAAQLDALAFAATRLLGANATISEQAAREFGITLSTANGERMNTVRAAIDRELPGAAPLVTRVEALRRRTTVPRHRAAAVMDAALGECRRSTSAATPLPAGERVRLTFKPGLGWDGYAHYAGGSQTDIEINADAPLDVGRAARLACHEGYPGHHVQHLLIEAAVSGGGRRELELSPGFGPHLLFAEGAAEAGADLAFSAGERLRLYRDILFPAAGLADGDAGAVARLEPLMAELLPVVTDVARQYLDHGLRREDAIARLTHEALVLNAEGTLALIERRRARALVYGEGRLAVQSRMTSRDVAAATAAFAAALALQ
jgi:hypothetical protein